MKLGSCPHCGGHDVSAGRIFLLHFARLAHGSHRRYCRSCRRRWTAAEKAVSPAARRAAALLLFSVLGLALACVVNEVWLAPRPCPLQTAAWAEAGAGMQDPQAFAEGGMDVAYGQELAARMQLSGVNFTAQDYGRLRGMAGQGAPRGDYARRAVQEALRQNGGQQSMPELLRRAAAVIKPMGKKPGQFASEVESSDKQTLWDKYGNNFSSKDEARAAYEQFKQRRGEIPNDWPAPPK